MVPVIELVPGMRVRMLNESAVFVAQCEHPLYVNLRLVIWRMDEGGEPVGRWSHDALAYNQEVGPVDPSTREQRRTNLRMALLDRSQWGPISEEESVDPYPKVFPDNLPGPVDPDPF